MGIRRDITKTHITLERQIKYGCTKGCAACFGAAKLHSLECRARFQKIVDNEAAETAAASASEPHAEMQEQAVGGSAPSFEQWPSPGGGKTRAGGCQHGTRRELGTADEFCGSDDGG